MTLKSQLYVAAFAVIVAVLAYAYNAGSEAATLRQRLHASDSLVVALSKRAKATDTLYRRDTVRLRVATQHWDTVKAGVDTVTLSVPVETVRYIIATADTTIRACSLVVQTCEQRVAQRDSIILTLKSQRPLLTKGADGRMEKVAKKVGWVLLGAGAGYIVAKQQRDPSNP